MGKMYFAKEETSQQILSAVNDLSFGGGGGFDVELAPVTNAVATNGNLKNFIKWKDPKDCVIEGGTFARWAGTKVVRKEGSAPTGIADGEVILDSKIKNAYEITPYEDTGLTADVDYYYAFFPYNDEGVHTLKNFVTVHQTPRTDKAPATMSTSVSSLDVHNNDYLKEKGFDLTSTHYFKKTVEVTSNSDGEIVAISNDPDIAVVNVDGTTVTITGVNTGTTTVVISQYEGTDFISPKDVTVTVTVTSMKRVMFENLKWQNLDFVKTMIEAGLAQSFWDAGDIIPIKLNGDLKGADGNKVIGFSDEIYYATVLGFDHNTDKESEGKHSMHFIVGQDAKTKKQIAFSGFAMNTENTNKGGWKNSQMRTVTCTSFYECLPADLKAIIGTVTKYSDNGGGGSAGSPSTNMSATQDKIFLLSEYEVYGTKTLANDNEASYQEQYDYYKNGNSKIRYNAQATDKAVGWWCRSVRAMYHTQFCTVNMDGSDVLSGATPALGFAPGFAIIA